MVSETKVETAIAKTSVSANSRNRRPIMPSIKIIGMNAAPSERLIESTVKPNSCAPFSAAVSGASPASICRCTFSTTTIASSTTKPTAIVIAIKESVSSVNPATHIAAKLPAIESGTDTPTAMVCARLRRKTSTTPITNTMATSSVFIKSRMEERMDSVRSVSVLILTPAGIQRPSSGRSALTASTVSITLASGCFVICKITAGLPLNQPAARILRTPLLIVAMSPNRTAAPFRLATIIDW